MDKQINFNEYSIIVCSHCKLTVKRYNAGKYGNIKDTRWVDDTGAQFNGKNCPPCHRSKVAARKRANKRHKITT